MALIIDRQRFQVPAILSVRNVLEFVLLGYAVAMVARLRLEARAREVRHTARARRRMSIR